MEYKNDIPERRPEKPEEHCGCKDGCERECSVHTNVNVPVELEPEAKIGKVVVDCCGEPEVCCECTHEGTIRVIISQNLFVKIPICYEVKIKHGKSHAECRDCKM